MKNSIVENALNYNEGMIKLMKSKIDGELSRLNHIDYYVKIDEKIEKVLNDEGLNTGEKYDFMKQLYRLKNSTSIIEDICLYIEKDDIIISSRNVVKPSVYFENQCKMDGYTFEDWKSKFLQEIGDKNFYPAENISISNTLNQKIIIYKSSLFSEKTQQARAHILIMVNADEIQKSIENYGLTIGSRGLIIDTKGNVILDSGSNDFDYDIQNLVQKNKVLIGEDKDQIEVYLKSDQYNLVYVTMLDKEWMLKDVKLFVRMGIILMILYFVFGMVLIRFSGHIIYDPIKLILKKIRMVNKSKNDDYYSELEFISNNIDNFVSNEIEYIHRIEELSNYKKWIQLRMLLTDSMDEKNNPVDWEEEHFLVMIVKNTINELVDDENHKLDNLTKYGILNILQELVESVARNEVVEIENDCVVVIFNLDGNHSDEVLNRLQKISEEMNDIVYQEFNIIQFSAISSIHKGKESISQCFNEAMKAIDFRFVTRDSALMRYDSINNEKNNEEIYYWPANLDEVFLGWVTKGCYKQIADEIDEIVSTNIKKSGGFMPVNEYVYYNLLGSFIRVSKKLMNYNFEKNIRYKKEWTMRENTEVIKEQFKQICDKMGTKGDDNITLLKKIEEYIENHFTDNNINLSQIADVMQVSVQYLATYFKNKKNTTLLKYITQKRMDYAKELLCESTLTLGDIALKVGYTDASVFAKAFKKAEGITPGQYRINNRQE